MRQVTTTRPVNEAVDEGEEGKRKRSCRQQLKYKRERRIECKKGRGEDRAIKESEKQFWCVQDNWER